MVSNTTYPSTMRGQCLLVRGFFAAWTLAVLFMFGGMVVMAVSDAMAGLPVNAAGLVIAPLLFLLMMSVVAVLFSIGVTAIPTGFDLGSDRLIVHRWRDDEWTIKYDAIASVQVRPQSAIMRGASSWAVRAATPMGLYFQFRHRDFGDMQVSTRGHRELVVIRLKDGSSNAFSPDDAVGFAVALEQAIASDGERPSTPIGRSTA